MITHTKLLAVCGLIFAFIIGGFATVGIADSCDDENCCGTCGGTKPAEQTHCPIMGKAINKEIHTTYKGKKVYFCCPPCKDKFVADPEKYLSKLPQFGGIKGKRVRKSFLSPGKMLGFAALLALLFTGMTAIIRRKNRPKFMHKLHLYFGILTLILAICHMFMMLRH